MANGEQSGQLDEVLAAYLKEEESGRHPDREEWIRKHPLVADGLREFFRDHDGFKAVAKRNLPLPAVATAHIDLMKKAPLPKGAVVRAHGTNENRFGDYELGEEIARGSMGIVYRARQVSLDRQVALKMMLETTFVQPEDLRRFRHEAKAAGHLEHPNIVPIYDVGESNGRQYYTMRLIPGGDLASVMGEFRNDARRAARMLAVIARAVDYAHRKGILHRDLKPANILLDTDGMPHVADFGLAKRMDNATTLTVTGRILGTVLYVSPEQSLGKRQQLTPASDVYSLGAIFYEMLTGEPPFTGDDAMEVLLRVREELPTDPVSRNPGIDRALATICMKCLEKPPALRYQSAKAMAEDLEAWLEERPIVARPPSVLRRLSRWAARHPSSVAAGITAIALSGTAALAILVTEGKDHVQDNANEVSAASLLSRSRTVDLADALMKKGKHAMARQLFEDILKDSKDPLEIMEAEQGLQKLAELERAAPEEPAGEL